MNPNYYEKSWLQAFKGAFLILLGIIAMMQIPGSIKSLAMFFSFFIGLTGFVLIVAPIILKKKDNKIWNITLGVLNLAFAFLLILIVDYPTHKIIWALIIWVVFNAISEIIEAVILAGKKNSFFALFLTHALLSMLLSYGLYVIIQDFIPEKLFNIGLIAIVFGIVNELSAFMLGSGKTK